MNANSEKSQQVRPRIDKKLWYLVRLGAARQGVSEQDWLAQIIEKEAARQGIEAGEFKSPCEVA
ncbi:MAG: hypothetical protein KME06_09575 [Kastovskya adunca ATA6-11-RM4]|nr:hypothetical protein [Kastovskya adunca ATA6-11-RM4]